MAKTDILFLTGFSTTGKTATGQKVARRLRWRFVDTDDEVAELAGKSVPEIFQQDGEERFRQYERWALQRVARQKHVVVATGGGITQDPANRQLMGERGIVICLEARPETVYQRLKKDVETDPALVRPLLAVEDPLQRIRSLKEARQPSYVAADWIIQTDHLTLNEVVEEILHGMRVVSRALRRESRSVGTGPEDKSALAFHVATSTETYPVYVGWGILADVGLHLREAGLKSVAYVVSDEAVFGHYGAKVMESIERAGFAVDCYTIPPGESSKTLRSATQIYDWLVKHRAERNHAIVALGGGVVGDLAGFVAATFLRGMPLVQVPTSLLAMVDAAIGGKVAVNRPEAKNLIGAFYQPRFVLVDVETLTTLPERELMAGWAETIKHGLILDPELFALLERRASALLKLEKDITVEVVKRSAAIKARVVEEDEKETTGQRTILNYGHTIGHALEAATGYEGMLHGEAVSVGMTGAAHIGRLMGVTLQSVVVRQQALLKRFGLPLSAPGVEPRALQRAIALDKKVMGRAVRWVLLEDIGRTIIRDDVPPTVVSRVLRSLTNTPRLRES